MKKIIKTIIVALVIISCSAHKKENAINYANKEVEQSLWHHKDYTLDGIPGISLDKWYKENNKKANGNIIVAVLDTQIDLNHEDLQGQIWVNKNEIPSNGIDDDNNGYIDDINGWNFLATKSQNYIVWYNYDYVRLIREYDKFFKGKEISEIKKEDINNFKEYQRALIRYDDDRKFHKNWLNGLNYCKELFQTVQDTLKYFFPKEDYTYQQIDSLYNKYKINDKTFRQRRLDNDRDLGALIGFKKFIIDYDLNTLDKIIDKRDQIDSLYNKSMNLDYDDNIYLRSNSQKLEKGYGGNKLDMTIAGIRKYNEHNTSVSSVIAANRKNGIGIRGFSDNIKIMPLVITASGDENDKDIAMALYYAVDNGAKVINISSSKEFSVNKELVFDAMKYAEKHNVLIVHCAGNDSYDIDINPKYPNDNDYFNTTEICNNFINVGSTTHKLDTTFVSSFSNYGKENVDVFAPGSDIKVCIPNNQYEVASGTSFSAPMVSGTAALIWLYYPNLTVQEVKQIILESGTSNDIDVLVPGGEGKKLPFKELSKSGKALNVYNAMKMAKEMSKKNKI